jgi:hypothetical protein
MNYILSLGEDALCRPLPVMTSRDPSPSYPILAFVAFLVLLIFGLSACGESFASTCPGSQAASLSVCMPPSHPKHTHVAMHTHTKTKKLKPTPGPFPPPTPSPTPSPTPIVVTSELIMKTATHYLDLVLEGRYREAYALLSAEVRAGEPFDDFMQNPDYTLPSGCWQVRDILANQMGSQGGVASILLTQVSCTDESPMGYYAWAMRLQWQQGHLAIVSIGLYPTAPASQ